MLGIHLLLPFITMAAGALFTTMLNPQGGFYWGAAIGFGVGSAILAAIWLVFALLKRLVE